MKRFLFILVLGYVLRIGVENAANISATHRQNVCNNAAAPHACGFINHNTLESIALWKPDLQQCVNKFGKPDKYTEVFCYPTRKAYTYFTNISYDEWNN